MPRQWPPLTAAEIRDCLRRLGWVHERTESTHETWTHVATRRVVVVDSKWSPASSTLIQHFVEQQMGESREGFYCATKTTAKKINKKPR